MRNNEKVQFKIIGLLCAVFLVWTVADANGRKFMQKMTSTVAIDSTADSLPGGFIKTSTGAWDFISDVVEARTGIDVRSLNGAVVIGAANTTLAGFGLADSAAIYIKTKQLGFPNTILDSIRMAIPCTLWVNLANVNDTLFKRIVSIEWDTYDTSAADTITDNGGNFTYPVSWELTGRD